MTLDQIKHLTGELARPVSILATSIAAASATVIVAIRIDPEGMGIAAFVAAVYAGLAGLYWGRSWENSRNRRASDQPEG